MTLGINDGKSVVGSMKHKNVSNMGELFEKSSNEIVVDDFLQDSIDLTNEMFQVEVNEDSLTMDGRFLSFIWMSIKRERERKGIMGRIDDVCHGMSGTY